MILPRPIRNHDQKDKKSKEKRTHKKSDQVDRHRSRPATLPYTPVHRVGDKVGRQHDKPDTGKENKIVHLGGCGNRTQPKLKK